MIKNKYFTTNYNKNLENWIKENPWIEKTKLTYEEYKDYRYMKIPTVNFYSDLLSNIEIIENFKKVAKFWKLDTNDFPTEFFVILLTLSEEELELTLKPYNKNNEFDIKIIKEEKNNILFDWLFEALNENNLKLIKLIIKNGAEVIKEFLIEAMESDSIEIKKFAMNIVNNYEYEEIDLNNLTVNRKTLFKLDYYFSNNENLSFTTEVYIFLLHIVEKFGRGNFGKIKNKKIGKFLIEGIYEIIAEFNNLEVLIYALDNNIVTVNNTLIEMCEIGKLNFVIYLVSIGADIKYNFNDVIKKSIRFNHIEIVKYLLDQQKYDKDELTNILYDVINTNMRIFNTETFQENIKLLIEYGADKNEVIKLINNSYNESFKLRVKNYLENI